jgi:hypothetical protein
MLIYETPSRYSVATTNYPPPPATPDGSKYFSLSFSVLFPLIYDLARPPSPTTWHHILSFNPNANNYLRTLQRGSQVYVEANFELRTLDSDADPDSPQAQRQILLRHGKTLYNCRPGAHSALVEAIRVLRAPPNTSSSEPTEPTEDSS